MVKTGPEPGQDERRVALFESEQLSVVPRRHLPALNDRNRAFWQGGRDGALMIQRCRPCGHYIHPAGPICPICRSRDVAPEAVAGRATVATYTINRQRWEPGLEAPYVIAIVELAEQASLRLTTNIVGCPPDQVQIGMRVRVVFDHREDVWLPLFVPEAA